MKFRICICLAMILALTSAACAEPAAFAPEAAREVVEALFAAVAGTDTEAERAAREGLSEEDCLARSAELAAYRADTLPWLCAAFTPEDAEAAGGTDAASERTGFGSAGAGSAAQTGNAPAFGGCDAASERAAFDSAWERVRARTGAADSGEEADAALAPDESWRPEIGYDRMQNSQTGRAYLELMRSYGCDGAQACLDGTAAACRAWLAEVNGPALKELNPDYACWLYCPDTPIDYPVVQAEDNEKYLHRLFNGDTNACGTLFIDYRNLPGFQDPNTLIYGHHMRNGSMFKAITYYTEQSWYEAHPFMLLISPEEIAVLELFAGYTTNKNDHCYDIAVSDEGDMRSFIEEAQRKSDFYRAPDAEPGERLVTLSTCAYAFQNARYIAIARLNSLWTKPDDM